MGRQASLLGVLWPLLTPPCAMVASTHTSRGVPPMLRNRPVPDGPQADTTWRLTQPLLALRLQWQHLLQLQGQQGANVSQLPDTPGRQHLLQAKCPAVTCR